MKLTALAFAATLPLLGILPPHAAERSRPVQDKVPQQAVRSATVIFLRHAEALPRTARSRAAMQTPLIAAAMWLRLLRRRVSVGAPAGVEAPGTCGPGAQPGTVETPAKNIVWSARVPWMFSPFFEK